MGAGRKTSTYDYDSKSAAQLAQQSFEQRQRNLGANLGGCIFGCTNQTIQECLDDQVFGLPRAHWCYVQWITKGMPIFLFNYNTRKLHGIFQAESDGEWEIKPAGWCMGVGQKTQFPSQAKVRMYKDCEPLTDREYRQVLSKCFSEDGHLLFELKAEEAKALCRAFSEKTDKVSGKRSSDRPEKPMPSATGASSALARGEMKVFRPSSPPAVSAWGTPSLDRASKPKAVEKPPQEPPRPLDFPSLGGASSAAASAVETTSAWGHGAEEPSPAPAVSVMDQKNESGYDSSKSAAGAEELAAQKAAAEKLVAQKAAAEAKARSKKPTISAANGPDELYEEAQLPAAAAAHSVPENGATDVVGASSSKAHQKETVPAASLGRGEPVSGAEAASGSKAYAPRPSLASHEEADRPAANGNAQTARVQDGTAQAYDEHVTMLENAFLSTRGVDQAAADNMVHLYSHIKNCLGDRMVTQVVDVFKREKAVLEQLVLQQSQAIEVLKEECQALRRDLSFVGGHINITVAPENPAVDSLPLLPMMAPPQISLSQQNTTSCADHSNSIGVGSTSESMLLLGGNDMAGGWLSTMDIFTPSSKQWVVMGQMPSQRGYGAAAAVSGHVYLMGGGAGTEWQNDVLRYDIPADEWFQMAPMEEARGSFAAVALNSKVYAIGGGRKGEQSAKTEVMDPIQNIWMPSKAMHSKRFAVAAGVLNGCIIAVGGFNGSQYLATVERYDPREGCWELLSSMIHRRGGHQVVADQDELHILGGWDSGSFLDSAEVYDARKNEWRTAPRLTTARAYFGAARLDGVMYALGGMASQKDPNELVEYFDSRAEKWRTFAVDPSNDENGRKRFFVAPCKLEL